MSDSTIYIIIVAAITAFVIGGVLLDRFAPRASAIIMLVFAILCAVLTLVVLFGSGAAQPKALTGGAFGTAIFYSYYRRYLSKCPPRKKEPNQSSQPSPGRG